MKNFMQEIKVSVTLSLCCVVLRETLSVEDADIKREYVIELIVT